MKSLINWMTLCIVLIASHIAEAEVPQMMSFQGRFCVNGTNFDGVAQFRFALVDAGTTFFRPYPQLPIILYNTYWSHDGSSSGGNAPTSSVPVVVSKGIYTVLLGDTTLSNMTQSIPPSVFTNSGVYLRVWVDTGTNVQKLSPDQRITATAYALKAANVDLGAITTEMIAEGAITGAKIQAGSIKTSQLDDGGSSAFQSMQEVAQTLGGDASLGFADILPMPGNSSAPVTLSFSLNGSPFGTVIGFSGSEGISKPYSYMVQVVASGALIPAEAIGNPAVLTFSRGSHTTTYGGIVTACTLGGVTASGRLYNFRIESPLANLALKSDYAINQDMSAPVVASRVYQNNYGSLPVDNLQGTYNPAIMLVQYEETDLSFFSRILEYEGISYYFDQSTTPPTLTLADSVFPASPNGPFPYYGDMATNIERLEYIRTFQNAVHQSTLRATVNSYNFTTPSGALLGTAVGANGVGENYEFGGSGNATKSINDALAHIRIDRQKVERALISGSSTVPDLRAGYKFGLSDNSAAGIEGTYLIVSVRHAAFVRVTNGVSTCFYGNRFEAIPSTLQYRPALLSPKPKAQSCTAVVTGPTSEEIHVDNYGRIKLQFHWDRYGAKDENSSGWVRVASPWAGNNWGIVFLPRVGQEVLVDFIQGNPDQPVVIGSLYNETHMPPYGLPADKTKSTIKSLSSKGGGGYNEFRFEDKKGSEEVFIHAEKDLNIVVKNDTTFNTTHDFTMQVSHDFTFNSSHDLTVRATGIGTLGASTFQLSATNGIGINLNGSTPLSALHVNGTVRATAFQGDGSALTGSVSDSRLSTNVALRNANQTFTGQNSFTGPLSVNSVQSQGNFTLHQNDIFLKDDDKHGLGYYGASKLFGVLGIDGPVLYGYSGGALGTKTFDTNLVSLLWNNSGNVTIGATNTPSARLDIFGSTIIRSNLVVYGSISNVGAFYTSGGLLTTSLSVNMAQTSSAPANTWSKIGDIGVFTKQQPSSILELTLNSRFAISSWGSGAAGAEFELRIDNATVTSGRARVTVVPSDNTAYGISGSIDGIFNNLAAGNHTVSVWVYPYAGSASFPTVNPGGFSGSHLVVKEFK
jgi:type VI secretion system secreted protein VgrG